MTIIKPVIKKNSNMLPFILEAAYRETPCCHTPRAHTSLKPPYPIDNTNTQTQIPLNSLSCTLSVSHTHLSKRLPTLTTQPEGSPSTQVPPFAKWILPLKVPGARHCQRRYEDTRENGRAKKWRQSLTASTSLPPLWCDGFVMWRSCQISGPVTALSACLLGLTESVMELRLNKRVITFPVLNHTTLSYVGRREEKASVLRAERSRGGERVTLQPSSKKV